MVGNRYCSKICPGSIYFAKYGPGDPYLGGGGGGQILCDSPVFMPVCSPHILSMLTATARKYSGTCLRWSLSKAATSLKQPASLVPDNTKALKSISVEQPPLYNGQLELAHRRLA